MIVFDLECRTSGHRFEGWFGSSQDFVRQQEQGLVACPQCGSAEVIKAPMAPHLARKGNQKAEAAALPAVAQSEPPAPVAVAAPAAPVPVPMPPQVKAALVQLAQLQAEALKQSRWVGKSFAQDVRAMHYGDKEAELIHGQASPKEAMDLLDEGIDVAPVLFPTAPPDEIN